MTAVVTSLRRYPALQIAGRTAMWLALVVIAAWGARVIWLDVLRFAPSRPFGGDFPKAIETQIEFPQTVVYGAVFVIETWLHERWPDVFSITAFALANVGLVAIAFVACVYACRLHGFLVLVALASWLAGNLLPIALLNAANPEILEMTLLSLAWLAASRSREILEGTALGFAAMTKLVPVVLGMQLLARWRLRAVAAMAAVAMVLTAVVGLAKGFTPLEAVMRILLPFGPYSFQGSYTVFESRQYSNLASALGRVILGGETSGADRFSPDDLQRFNDAMTLVGVMTAGALVLAATWVAWIARRSPVVDGTSKLALTYGAFFAILPVVSLAAHPHTFVFLLPVWTTLTVLISTDRSARRRSLFGSVFAAGYALVCFPLLGVAVDRVLGTSFIRIWANLEPIWPTLLIALTFVAYAAARSRASSPPTPSLEALLVRGS